jgi:hypothetical protein
MNARFLLLPVLALFVALSGCDAGSPTADGLQTGPPVVANLLDTISGPGTVHINCSVDYSFDGTAMTGDYFTASGLSGVVVSNTSLGHATVTVGSTPGSFTLSFMRPYTGGGLGGTDAVLAGRTITVERFIGDCN